MSNTKHVDKVTINFDKDTCYLLRRIVDGAITMSNTSGIPIDPNYYSSIEKLKLLSEFSGDMTIELAHTVVVSESRLAALKE